VNRSTTFKIGAKTLIIIAVSLRGAGPAHKGTHLKETNTHIDFNGIEQVMCQRNFMAQSLRSMMVGALCAKGIGKEHVSRTRKSMGEISEWNPE
jgi:hypothetical protein